jgi:parvulin-like peptidyl-prolyl isomerase
VVALEVSRLGLDKTDEYRRRAEEGRNGAVFGAFVQKVVIPDVKLEESQVRAYYDAHQAEYSAAAFYKVESIGFSSQKAAEAAVAKLRSGTDFKWLNANADGKLTEGKDTERPGGVISSKAMTGAFAKAMEGARSGDYRVFAPSDNQFYAVHVLQVTPPMVQPYEEVRDTITQKLYGEVMQKSVQDWMTKLRKAHKVDVYLTRMGS